MIKAMTILWYWFVIFLAIDRSWTYRVHLLRNLRPITRLWSGSGSLKPLQRSLSLSNYFNELMRVNLADMKGAPLDLLQKLRDLQTETESWQVEDGSLEQSTSIIHPQEWRSLISSVSTENNVKFSSLEIGYQYLFWRISSTLQTFDPDLDLFLPWKGRRLTEGLLYMEDLCGQLPDVLDLPLQSAFPLIAVSALYGEDPSALSLISKSSGSTNRAEGRKIRKFDIFSSTIASLERSIVSNEIATLVEFLSHFLTEEATFETQPAAQSEFRVHIVPSCAGRGLIGDLVIAELLLAYGATQVTFHCGQITNLDDIPTRKDVILHTQHLANPSNSDIWALRHVGESLNRHIFAGRIVVEDHDMILSIPEVITNPTEKSLVLVRNKRIGDVLTLAKHSKTEKEENDKTKMTALIYLLPPEELSAKQKSRYRADPSLDFEPVPGLIKCV